MLRANQDLQSALTEREVLVKEVHHRVKNNLQVVVSLLRLQASRLRDEAGSDALRESLNRVSAMSTIHELLYRSTTMADIDFAEVLRTLTGNLHDAYGLSEERISMVVEADPVPVSMDAAVPLALIANELISNAFKHGFPDGAEGEVRVGLTREGDTVVLLVVRYGTGFRAAEAQHQPGADAGGPAGPAGIGTVGTGAAAGDAVSADVQAGVVDAGDSWAVTQYWQTGASVS